MALEIERKFLLKRLPIPTFDRMCFIDQFYYSVGERFERWRYIKEGKDMLYRKTMKTAISHGVFEEEESDVTAEEYAQHFQEAEKVTSFIQKIRYKYNVDGLVWEVDYYINLHLIIAEIELPDINHKFEFPDFIQKNLIMEVTGIPEFSNYKLGII